LSQQERDFCKSSLVLCYTHRQTSNEQIVDERADSIEYCRFILNCQSQKVACYNTDGLPLELSFFFKIQSVGTGVLYGPTYCHCFCDVHNPFMVSQY